MRQVAPGAPELAGELGHRLPADEEPHEDARGAADRPPAVRGERRPVVAAATRERDPDCSGDHDDESRREHELEPGRDAESERVGAEHHAAHRETDPHRDRRSRAGEVGDVVAADQCDGRAAEEHRGHEARAGHRRRAVSEPDPNVGGDAAGDGVPHAERSERASERGGEDEQARPCDDRGRSGRLHRQRGNEQDARADQRADVERRAAEDTEASVCAHRARLARK